MTDGTPTEPGPTRAGEPDEDRNRAEAAAAGADGTIGPYRLMHKIGEGGMGEVWLAEQVEPVRRRVALKVIKAGMDTRYVVARFEAERQALALMDHPAIAMVFDAGETPRGRPYFVMEHVKGEPITAYCDRHKLGTAERLKLFIRVCEGVQHAHQKGVIHRDLKPSNVLVTVLDGIPVPKIIDFGVAKAIAQPLTERTTYTELGVPIGTPEYMSPEQAEMTGLDVDTRTDVYALGVMLYQLLTGALPFDPKELRASGFDGVRKKIRESDPPRPSTRVSTSGALATETAQNRRTDPGRLVGRLKGDLDWITMKALEKDRTRRYQTPTDLAADIERHLRNQPVLAGPPSASYRLGKFVRRHRFGVAAASIGLVVLVGFAAAMAVQAHRIALERNRAERVSEFMTELFEVSDPDEAQGNTITAREILDKGARRIETGLNDEPEVQSQLMLTMATVYQHLGFHGESERLAQKSFAIRREILGDDHPDTLASLHALATAVSDEGRLEEGEKLGREVFEKRRRTLGEDDARTLASAEALGGTLWALDRVPEAEKIDRETLERRRRVLGEDHPDTLQSTSDLGGLLVRAGRYEEAENLSRELFEKRRRVLGADHRSTLGSMANMASALAHLERYAEAESVYRDLLERLNRVLGADHPQTLRAKNNLANLYTRERRYDEAEAVFDDVLERVERVLGPDHPQTLRAADNLAALYLQERRFDDAEKLFRETLDRRSRVLGEDHEETVDSLYDLARLNAARGDSVHALQWLGQAVDHGFRDADRLEQEADFGPLRGAPQFAALLARVRNNGGP